jgi:integral membrane protein
MKGRSLKSLSIIGFLEGLSLLVLLFIAMPVKYFLQHDQLVKITGPIHGGIFLLYIVIAVVVTLEYRWKLLTLLLLLLASVVPFGFLYVEYKIIRPEKQKLAANPDVQPSASNQKMYLWLKRIGVSGFLFFLVKGLVWVAIFAGLIKGC